MLIAELWTELKALPQTLGQPLHDPTWFRQHTAAHLVGGPLWWGLGLLGAHGLVGGWRPWWALAFAVTATVVRQGWAREVRGVSQFPLWAMMWDSVTSGLAAGVWAVAFAVARG